MYLTEDGCWRTKQRPSWLPNHRVALLVSQVTLSGVKSSIPFVGRPLCFCCEEESFVFKELLELVYVCHRSMKWFHAVASFPKQVNKIRLLKVLFVKKLLWVNWTWVLFTILLSPFYCQLVLYWQSKNLFTRRQGLEGFPLYRMLPFM